MKKRFAKYGLITSMAALAASAMTVSASAAGETAAQGGPSSMIPSLLIMVLLFAVMYFILIRPQKKKEKEQKAMQRDLCVGDEVVTIGGIVGLVVKTTEDTVVIECGGDRSRLRMKKWAIQENVTVREDAERAREAAASEAQKKKEAKKKGKNADSSENNDDQGMLKD
ncbi:MAG: preprotein translocase subunit YajC [Ruminococcus sp.]